MLLTHFVILHLEITNGTIRFDQVIFLKIKFYNCLPRKIILSPENEMHPPQKLNFQSQCVTSNVSGAVVSSQIDIYLRNMTEDIFSEATRIPKIITAPASHPQKFKWTWKLNLNLWFDEMNYFYSVLISKLLILQMHVLSSALAQPCFSQLSCAKLYLSDNGAP